MITANGPSDLLSELTSTHNQPTLLVTPQDHRTAFG